MSARLRAISEQHAAVTAIGAGRRPRSQRASPRPMPATADPSWRSPRGSDEATTVAVSTPEGSNVEITDGDTGLSTERDQYHRATPRAAATSDHCSISKSSGRTSGFSGSLSTVQRKLVDNEETAELLAAGEPPDLARSPAREERHPTDGEEVHGRVVTAHRSASSRQRIVTSGRPPAATGRAQRQPAPWRRVQCPPAAPGQGRCRRPSR